MLPAIARAGATFVPLDALRTAVSQYGASMGFRPSHDIDDVELRENAMSTCAAAIVGKPTVVPFGWFVGDRADGSYLSPRAARVCAGQRRRVNS